MYTKGLQRTKHQAFEIYSSLISSTYIMKKFYSLVKRPGAYMYAGGLQRTCEIDFLCSPPLVYGIRYSDQERIQAWGSHPCRLLSYLKSGADNGVKNQISVWSSLVHWCMVLQVLLLWSALNHSFDVEGRGEGVDSIQGF